MKAIICTKYGSPEVLQLREVAKPAPQNDEVLIRVHAASVNTRDWRFMRAKPFFIRLAPGGSLQPKNKILGGDDWETSFRFTIIFGIILAWVKAREIKEK